ncbi:MAG: large conductance mechanosensitive channel [Frankiaceae bacterium]|jgi:large conductance mechanosensitive channel|nr:large conductance mechanosensitive channel [Frankiaceae bacterium]
MSGFKKFLLRGNVVDLAVAVVIGAAFTAVVGSFTDGIITPLIGAIGGTPDFSAKSFTINSSRFTYGSVINALIYFLIVAAVVYFFVVNPINQLMDRFKPTPEEPTPVKDCTECLSSIPAAARKCAFCASVQAA